jgi:hypothetical protein
MPTMKLALILLGALLYLVASGCWFAWIWLDLLETGTIDIKGLPGEPGQARIFCAAQFPSPAFCRSVDSHKSQPNYASIPRLYQETPGHFQVNPHGAEHV